MAQVAIAESASKGGFTDLLRFPLRHLVSRGRRRDLEGVALLYEHVCQISQPCCAMSIEKNHP